MFDDFLCSLKSDDNVFILFILLLDSIDYIHINISIDRSRSQSQVLILTIQTHRTATTTTKNDDVQLFNMRCEIVGAEFSFIPTSKIRTSKRTKLIPLIL